jgi:hypothetical protein
VWNAIGLATAMLLPTLLAGAVLGGVRLVRWLHHRRRPPVAAPRPIEQIARDARRLRRTLADYEEQSPEVGRSVRLRALRAAYADALVSACSALEVTPPARGPGDDISVAETFRVEDALRARGLDVRQTAVR